jgi:hypothetical protein
MTTASIRYAEKSVVVPPTRRITSTSNTNKSTTYYQEEDGEKDDDTPTTISIVHHRRNVRFFPPTVIMQSDREMSWAERNESKNSSSSCDAEYCTTDTDTSRRIPDAPLDRWMNEESSRTLEDDDESESVHAFMLTQSPMPSLRKVDENDLDAKNPSGARGTTTTRRRAGLLLDRTTSAPIPSTKCTEQQQGQDGRNSSNNCRRSIFGSFWESDSCLLKQKKERFQMPRRGHSLSVLETSSPYQSQRVRPGQFASMSLRPTAEYYVDALDSSFFLPSVPAPLERLLSRSSGVYPLFEPKSILKKDNRSVDDESVVVDRIKPMLTKVSSDGSNTVEDNATETTCASSSTGKTVHFDPRVVVTEIHDPYPRSWYSDQELQKFQSDTCNLAKAYLQMHPELIPLYSKPVYDPTIKKMRRKPIFGLRGLSDLDECLNDIPIKRILVVSSNDKILNLLSRSLQTIFPAAEMVRTHTGPSALEILKKTNVDIAICQEHLLSPRNCSCGEVDTSTGLFTKYRQEAEEKWRRTLLISLAPVVEKSAETSSVGHGTTATDLVWSLPPPKMNLGLRGTLVVALDKKRRSGDCH